jgi:hypothetical protein
MAQTFPDSPFAGKLKLKGEAEFVFRRIKSLALWFALLVGVGVFANSAQTFAQGTPAAAPDKPPAAKDKPPTAPGKQQPTAEGIAESVVYLNGTREGMAQIRRNGVERGRTTRTNADGKTVEATYERRFIRGENMLKDRVRIDQKQPTAEYALIYSDGQTWGIINEAVFAPKQETAQEFLAQQWHSLDTLLRYKENGSTLNYIGKEKQMGVDQHVLDVTDKEQRKTRFYISAKTARILSLEYEEAGAKFVRKFYDYRIAQGTFAPFRTVLYRDGKQLEETRIMTITYGSKLDEAIFRNPEAPETSTAAKP